VVARHAPFLADLETFWFQSNFTHGIRNQFQSTGRAAHHGNVSLNYIKEMAERISNLSTSTQKVGPYFIALYCIGFFLFGVYKLIKKDFFMTILLMVISLFLFIFFYLVYKFNSLFYEAFIDDNYIYIIEGRKKNKIKLNEIQSVEYHSFLINPFGEPMIKIVFKNNFSFGNKVVIKPTNLDKNNNYHLNNQVLDLIKTKINEYYNRINLIQE